MKNFSTLRILYLVYLLSICFISQLHGQRKSNYNISVIDVSHGLSNNYVATLTEDKFGYKWFGTKVGLNKYDGESFKIFTTGNTPELLDDCIEFVFSDSKSNLWISTFRGGITFYNSKEKKFYNYSDIIFEPLSYTNFYVTGITEGADGNIYIGTCGYGVFVFDPESMARTSHLLEGKSIMDIVLDNDDKIWITSREALYKYHPTQDSLFPVGIEGYLSIIRFDSTRNRLWYGYGRQGLSYISLDSPHLEPKKTAIDSGYLITGIAINPSGNLMIGTCKKGFYIYEPSTDSYEKYYISISSYEGHITHYQSFQNFHYDKNNILWAGTSFGGVVKLMPINNFLDIKDIFGENEIPSRNIKSLGTDVKNRIWFGMQNTGVFVKHNEEIIEIDELPDDMIYDFLEHGEQMLVGTEEGMYSVNIDDLSVSNQLLLKGIETTSLCLSKNNRLWIGTYENGLYYVDSFDHTKTNFDVISAENWSCYSHIRKFSEDKHGNIWIGTNSGLFVYDTKQDKYICCESLLNDPLPGSIINDLYFDDSNSKLWLALSGGLAELSIKNTEITDLKIHGAEEGLKNDFVASISKTSDGNFWLGTAHGIAKFIPQLNVFETYRKSSGVPVNSFNANCITTISQGKLMLGANDGLAMFDTKEINNTQVAPKVLISSFEINGEEVDINSKINNRVVLKTSFLHTSDIKLTYKDKTCTFHVSTHDYLGNENVQYSYRMVGLNDQWSKASSNNEIRYHHLESGKYRLEVRATRDNYHWSDVISKNITVAPPPWTTWYAYLFYIAAIAMVAYLTHRVSRKQANLQAKLDVERIAREKEQELSEDKNTFFTNISHEFRTPLTLILSPVSEILMQKTLDDKIKERLTIVQRNTGRLLNLVNQLLDLRKSENGLLQLQVTNSDFTTFAHDVFSSFETLANSKNISFTYTPGPQSLLLPFDRDKMEIVLVNLLSNAFKFTPENGKIQVKIETTDEFCCIQVINSGEGIPPEHINHVFDRFYQIPGNNLTTMAGSGIGLSLTKNIIELHHGSIKVESQVQKQTIFTIEIPINADLFSASDFIAPITEDANKINYAELNQHITEEDKVLPYDKDKQTILIVDDNKEIRDYLSSMLFEEGFNILTANNGAKALLIANEKEPGLIISDIMMPEMDGITLCEKLKNDINTSHIPVILLTARNSSTFEVNGLQTGADDYIKKPFHPAIVKTRVNSILNNRVKLREYFVNKLRFEPSEPIEAPGSEEKFIQKAIGIIEEGMYEPEFGVEHLIQELAMSKSTLYRKLKSLTGLSGTAFIRSVKLKKAAELMIKEDWKLSQVAFESGFNDYTYFKTCFREHFGCLPSEYRSKKTISG
ncbi:MAG: response regulator [Bacteroidales bacterium]|nr:response regulator [Bacteroidales bacterium]